MVCIFFCSVKSPHHHTHTCIAEATTPSKLPLYVRERAKPQGLLLLGHEAAIRDEHLGGGAVVGAGLRALDLPHDVHALHDLAEDDVLVVEVRRLGGGDEELAAVGVLAGVGHGQQPRLVVLEGEVLVLEARAVDALAAGAVPVGEVAALDHEVGDDAVERAALVAHALARRAVARAERLEVGDGARYDGLEKRHDDAPLRLAADADVEEHARAVAAEVRHVDHAGLVVVEAGGAQEAAEGRLFPALRLGVGLL
mmetsp:Transcript_8227/g.23432  ORF Transcript_8227/g.23432 Transcript_8227/m.23432 type:complete len:254 (-) Transcript_8227:1069-1830(-)